MYEYSYSIEKKLKVKLKRMYKKHKKLYDAVMNKIIIDNARQDAKIKDYRRYVFMDKCV